MKTLKITEETHEKLMIIKTIFKLKTINSTIEMLIEDHEFTNEVLEFSKEVLRNTKDEHK